MFDKEIILQNILRCNHNDDDIRYTIHSVDDFLSFAELFKDGFYDVASDFSQTDIYHAYGTGKMMVYGIKPIINGRLITPSKKKAALWSQGNDIYQAQIDIKETAWINDMEGYVALDKDITYEKISCGELYREALMRSELDYHKALRYFRNEDIICSSETDKDTISFLYDTLTEDNNDTEDEDNMKDAISTLDTNVYRLCESIIYQNFMLMRKVDALSKKIKLLESKIK